MSGSGLFTRQHAAKAHLLVGSGGVAAEVADLRNDMLAELSTMAAMAVDEYTNPVAAAAAGLEAATATTVAPRTVLAAGLLAPGKAALLAYGRNVTFTTAGVTPADAPATALVTGTGMDGLPLTETVTLAQTATIANGVKAFKTIVSVAYAAADGTAATVSIGFGVSLGLGRKPKARAGLAAPIQEIAVGVLVTTGVISDTNRTYTPAAAPDGVKDYAVYYEYDAAVA